MLAALLLLALPIAPQSADAATLPDEVTVVARARGCDLRFAQHLLSRAELKAKAAQWALGRPVTVIVPAHSDPRCLAKILFRLADYGVDKAVFVDR